MRKLIEFPEFPLGERRVVTRTDCAWVLVVFLKRERKSLNNGVSFGPCQHDLLHTHFKIAEEKVN
jgi:hypothetical protein